MGIRSHDGEIGLTLREIEFTVFHHKMDFDLGAFFQEFIEGIPCAAVFLGDGQTARLLGVTRQLVGEAWLHAAPFHYCGSIGPMPLTSDTFVHFRRLGHALADGFSLRGLFGVDCVLRDGVPWPVEINPRYTASVEVIEYASGLRALNLHRLAFEDEAAALTTPVQVAPPDVVGKAVLFAPVATTFGPGPWSAMLASPLPIEAMPAFADLPAEGSHQEQGGPVLTLPVGG